MLRVLMCGDRNWWSWTPIELIVETFESGYGLGNWLLIEGEALGADKMARRVAEQHGMSVDAGTILPFPADWNSLGRRAGPVRNQQMLDEGKPRYVIAFHDDLASSKGTADMVKRALKARIPTVLINSVCKVRIL